MQAYDNGFAEPLSMRIRVMLMLSLLLPGQDPDDQKPHTEAPEVSAGEVSFEKLADSATVQMPEAQAARISSVRPWSAMT